MNMTGSSWTTLALRNVSGQHKLKTCRFESLESRKLLAVVAEVAADVNQIPNYGSPTHLTEFRGDAYFISGNTQFGSEVWRHDPETNATNLFIDLNPGAESSAPVSLTVAGDRMYFIATTAEFGRELWVTDGSVAGTHRLTDLYAGGKDTPISGLTAMGSQLYFSAESEQFGEELYRTDGTVGGTVLVRDIAPTASSSSPRNLTAVGAVLYFEADNGATGRELWRSDGTADGTYLVKDINVSGSSGPSELTDVAGTLFFRASNTNHQHELWKSDGTAAGTVHLKTFLPLSNEVAPFAFNAANERLFFAASDAGFGTELWLSDGTAEGTRIVADIGPGGASGLTERTVPYLRYVNGQMLFAADDYEHGTELWSTDGTPEGTHMVLDLEPGADASLDPSFPYVYRTTLVVEDHLFFAAETTEFGVELWRTDGTASGTNLVSDVQTPYRSTAPFWPIAINDTIYFQGTQPDTGGGALWRTKGTLESTQLIADRAAGSLDSNPRLVSSIDNRVLFVADDGVHGSELWSIEPASTVATLMDLSPGDTSSDPGQMTVFQGHAYFSAADASGQGTALWRTNGTPEGTQLVKQLDAIRYSIGSITVAGDSLFFTLSRCDGAGFSLWKSDGTAEGTVQLPTIVAPGQSNCQEIRELTEFQDKLYFTATDGLHGAELWRTDGTNSVMVADIAAGVADSQPRYLTVSGGQLYFTANGPGGEELWRSDGTEEGTLRVIDLKADGGSQPRYLTSLGDHLVFAADDGQIGRELWFTNGTSAGTHLVADIWPGEDESYPLSFLRVADRVFFWANDGIHGHELWVTDGSTPGTHLVLDATPGETQSSIRPIMDWDGTLLYGQYTPNIGFTLWRSDGTPEGTRAAAEGTTLLVSTGVAPTGAVLDGNAYMALNGDHFGMEVWMLHRYLEGDTNDDGVVDLTDLNNVRNYFGGDDRSGDADHDGDVDLEDLNLVRNNFGSALRPIQSTSVTSANTRQLPPESTRYSHRSLDVLDIVFAILTSDESAVGSSVLRVRPHQRCGHAAAANR